MEKQTVNIENRVANMESRLENMEKQIETLITTCNEIRILCLKMTGHVDFVEDVYETFKYPLNIVKSNVERIFGREDKTIQQ